MFRSSVEPDELPLIKEPDANDPKYQDFVAKLKEAEAAERALVKDLHVSPSTHAREKIEAYLLAALMRATLPTKANSKPSRATASCVGNSSDAGATSSKRNPRPTTGYLHRGRNSRRFPRRLSPSKQPRSLHSSPQTRTPTNP